MLILPPRLPFRDPQPVSDFNPEWRDFEWGLVRRAWLQVLATVALATGTAWLSRFWQPGPWNLSFLLIPFLIAFVANTRTARWAFGLLLALLFIASLIGNEVAAHFIFGTCLYD